MHDRGVGAERSLHYRSKSATIELTFAFPEVPFLVLTYGEGPRAERYRFAPSKAPAAQKLRRRYYQRVEAGKPSEESLAEAAAFIDSQTTAVREGLEALKKGAALGAPWSRH